MTKIYPIPQSPPSGGLRSRLPLKRSYRELRVLDQVSFTVREGEVFGVIGRNGAGKSTLLRLLAKLYEPDDGVIFVRGESASLADLSAGFSGSLSVRENVVMKGILLGLRRATIKSRFEHIVDFAELQGFEETKLKRLSSGMKSRLAFSVMMEMDPEILLLDEILSAGDAAFKAKAGHLLEQFRERGKTIVLVSHATSEIERLCDRAIWLEKGKVQAEGTSADVVALYNKSLGIDSEELTSKDDADPEAVRASIADLHVIEPERQDTADPIALEAQIEVTKHIGKPQLRLELYTEDGRGVFAPPLIPLRDENAGPLRAGESARLRLEIERALAAGSYTLNCALLNTTRNGRDRPVSPFSSVRFSVANGAERSASSSKLEHSARLERRQQRAGPT